MVGHTLAQDRIQSLVYISRNNQSGLYRILRSSIALLVPIMIGWRGRFTWLQDGSCSLASHAKESLNNCICKLATECSKQCLRSVHVHCARNVHQHGFGGGEFACECADVARGQPPVQGLKSKIPKVPIDQHGACCVTIPQLSVLTMNRIRRPTLRDQLSSDYRDESSSENDEDKAVASTQTKHK